jgi:homoserine dehydrogenase
MNRLASAIYGNIDFDKTIAANDRMTEIVKNAKSKDDPDVQRIKGVLGGTYSFFLKYVYRGFSKN